MAEEGRFCGALVEEKLTCPSIIRLGLSEADVAVVVVRLTVGGGVGRGREIGGWSFPSTPSENTFS